MTQTLSRLAPLRRTPFWAQAFAVCALFAIVSVATLDNYGVGWDENYHRRTTAAVADYALGISEEPPGSQRHDRYYGVAFEMPLLLLERSLGLQDTRHIYLTRHLLMRLFFIAGGFACAMLAYRMLGSRWIALFAMLMFLLHPRLYAHSIFNVKDVPFAAMLLIALYLTHRAFRRDTIGAFLLCGIGVGLAINLRVFGLMLLPMILVMRAPDLWQAGRAERKRILTTGVAFLAAALATVYIIHPYYWENPLRFIEGIRVLSQHPNPADNLFMGEIYRADAVPWNYIPVWFAITAPPLTLLLGAIGCAAVCWQAIARPLAALRDRETRFRVLLLGCFALPIIAVIALQSNIYNGWRHMYFLWAPFCLLAAFGLHTITNISMGGGIWKVGAWLPGWVCGNGLRRALAYGGAGAGLITTLTAMAALHPNQQVYFNALTDTETPGALAKRYEMDYWNVAQRESLEYLLARYPDDALRVMRVAPSWHILPREDRERIISFRNPHSADFYTFSNLLEHKWTTEESRQFYVHPRVIDTARLLEQPTIHAIRAYGSAIASVVAKDVEAYQAAYDDVAANGDSLARADFDIYAYDGGLYYLSADCAPPAPNGDGWRRMFLHITPADPADLPAGGREFGFENRDFWFDKQAAFFDGKCMNRRPLPDYAIARVSTGESVSGERAWSADVNLAARAAAQAVHDRILAGDYGAPVAQSRFDLYLRDNALTYLNEPCADGDADARFFLHIFPADPADLPAVWREFGFVNLDFHFADHGARIGDICVASLDLPDYPIDRIRTGQYAAGIGGDAWRVDVNPVAHAAAQAIYDGIAAGDYGRPVAQSDFDVYLRGNALAYLKEPCAEGDAHAPFFLHIVPADPADLPAVWREFGFVNLDFHFADYGARIGDKCVAERELPDYPIERIRTGQFVSGEGDLWRVEFAAER